MTTFLQFTVLGLFLGAIYAIAATGLVVTYNTTGVFNFAHGAVGMIAAFSFYQLWQVWNWPLLVALLAVVLVEAPLLAVAVEKVLMRRLHGASTERSLMVTLGLLLILFGAATAIWDPTVPRIVPEFFPGSQVTIFGINITWQQLITIIVATGMVVSLRYFFRVPRVGVAMRAAVDDPSLVAMSGAKPVRVSQMGWALGFMLAALAGCLIAPTISNSGLNIETLTLLVVNGYAAAVVGRLRSLPLTYLGAMVLGLSIEYCLGYLPGHIPQSLDAVIPEVVPVIFLFVVLLVIPATRLAAIGRMPTISPPRVPAFNRSVVGGVAVVAIGLISILFGGQFLPYTAQGLALGVVALSLVLLTGYAGQVSLCQLTFMGVGAFAMGKLGGGDSWWGLIVAILVSAAVGALVALPALRLRGLYLALATLAFAEAAYYAFFNNASIFGYGGEVTVGRLKLPGMHHVSDKAQMIEVAVAFGLCSVLVLALRRARFGRRLVAMNDSPAAFATLGMNAAVTKVAVFSLSAALAGLGGVLYAGVQGGISANDVQFFASLTLLLLVSIWGVRTVSGALLGGLSAAYLPWAQSHLPHALSDLTGLVAGVGIILLGRSPDGVLGLLIPWMRQHLRFPSRGAGDVETTRKVPELAQEQIGVVG